VAHTKLLRISFSILVIGLTLLLAGPGVSVAEPGTDTPPIRTAYVFAFDENTGRDYRDLLVRDGYDLIPVMLPVAYDQSIYLPLQVGSGAAQIQTFSRPLSVGATGLEGYDLYIIAHDTEGLWESHELTMRTIQESGKPVVAIGRGGREFLAAADVFPAHLTSDETGDMLVVTDKSQSRPFYEKPHLVELDKHDRVQVLERSGLTVAAHAPAQPGIMRVGGLAPDGPFPLVQFDERYVLWGFVDGPANMTEPGQALFLNSLWSGAGDLALPIAGTEIVPEAGFDEAFLAELYEGGQPLHALVQLDHIPDANERGALDERGVELQSYLSSTFYHALISPKFDPDDPFNRAMIRWLGPITPELKIDPDVTGDMLEARSAGVDSVLVTFHDDVGVEEAAKILGQYTQEFRRFVGQIWEAPYDDNIVTKLSQYEQVRWISAGPTPAQDGNDGSRNATGTDTVQNAVIPAAGAPTYLGLTGQGIRIAHFERRSDVNHPDLAGRVSIGAHAHANTSDRGTHKAGKMIGNGQESVNAGGANRRWRGHAPEATIVTEAYGRDYGTGVAYTDYFSDAINDFDAEVANHSYLQTPGRYDAVAESVDQIIRGDATDSGGDDVPTHISVWIAMNQGMRDQYNNEEGFYSIYSPDKNSISVGSVDSNDIGLSMFSSKGPTFDGRIKPDVVAPGCQVGGDGGITSTVADMIINDFTRNCINNPADPDDGDDFCYPYDTMCGTSMAGPATTGVIALMLEQYHLTYGPDERPLPSSFKALLVNTATDLTHTASDGSDSNDPDLCRAEGPGGTPLDFNDPLDPDCWIPYGPGPDFATGYGAINAVAAVDAVRGKMFLEDSLSAGNQTDDYAITVAPGRDELRVTLAWDDEPGDGSLAATDDQLVNDLDLRLIGPDGTHFPFVLDPLPAIGNLGNGGLDPIDQADIVDARLDDNDRDNVEQVLVENPADGPWTVRVTIEGGFPTGGPQSYSLAGDFRTFNILQPTTGEPVDAGERDDPVTFMVILEAAQAHTSGAPDDESTFADSVASDFEVRIDGTLANIISGSPAGDQFWLNVRPNSGVYDPDYYDLEVTWTGYGTATQSDAVFFLRRRIADRVIVIDHSGSMADYDKMPAAQNAGRLFVDQAMEDDRVAVVGFSTNASSPFPIDVVSAGADPIELLNAKAAINGLSPTNLTAIGKGLLQGKAEIDTAGGSSEVRRMVLLSDGMENEDPKYDTALVKGVIQPTDIVIDTVAVGPASAGHHTLLETIALDNSGNDFHVTETGGGGTLAATSTLGSATLTEWVLPFTLENRLADQYKNIAEDIRHEQRLWQVSGDMKEQEGRAVFDVYVDKGLASATFAVNWANRYTSMRMELRSPSGRLYKPGDRDVVYRSDQTHETWIIREPEGGYWEVVLLSYKAPTEYVAWLSARTKVNLQLFVATPPEQRVAGNPIHILAFLDDGKPIPDADVLALVRGPDDRTWQDKLWLHDDGRHGDGVKGDGIYGNWYLRGSMPGNYALRARAEGQSSLGTSFLRYANRTFFLKPLALYVHNGDAERASDFKRLLERHSWSVEVHSVNDVPSLDTTRYSLIIIGAETGGWATHPAFHDLVKYKIPVLGLNEGGYDFFGVIGLDIGWPNGAHGNGRDIVWHREGESIWRYPYEMTPLPKGPLTLYEKDMPLVDIFLNHEEPSDVTVYGWNTRDERYADLVMQGYRYMLWGFYGSPKEMTETGRELFVNTASFTAFGPRP